MLRNFTHAQKCSSKSSPKTVGKILEECYHRYTLQSNSPIMTVLEKKDLW